MCFPAFCWDFRCKGGHVRFAGPIAVALIAFLLHVSSPNCLAKDQAHPFIAVAQPASAARIDLSRIGYQEMASMERLSEDESNVSLDYVDASHLLLTFTRRELLKRDPACPPTHGDRMMHAVIMELPSGKVTAETEWYLHDHRRYLWSLGAGRFLLRKLNTLYTFDSQLKLKQLIQWPNELLWVDTTPDKRQLILESVETGKPGGNARYVVQFLDVNSLTVQRVADLNEPTRLEGASSGYTDSLHKGNVWLIRFGPNALQRRDITRVRTRGVPLVVYSSNNSFLVGRSAIGSTDYSVSAFSVGGRFLWRQHWNRPRYFLRVLHTAENSRFAVSSVRRTAAAIAADAKNADADGEPQPSGNGIEQVVEIFQTASGTNVQSLMVSPAEINGQNVAISSDGRQLAAIQHARLEIYNLPPVSDDEEKQFATLQAEVPEHYEPSVVADSALALDSDAADEEPDATADEAASVVTNKPEVVADTTQTVAMPAENADPPVDASGASVATFKVSTRVVVTDVVVTDNKGHLIKGLQQQDFKLTEDGIPQEIRYFDAASPDEEVERPKAPNNEADNRTEKGSTSVILFDMLNTPVAEQKRAWQQFVNFVRNKPKGARFALCALVPTSPHLKVIEGFTDDKDKLIAAASGKKVAPNGVGWQAGEVSTERSVTTVTDLSQEGRTGGWAGLLQGLENMRSEQQVTDGNMRSQITLEVFTKLGGYLSALRGRKNLIWLSGAFPISLIADSSSSNPSTDNSNYESRIKHTANLLADGEVSVYPVDVRGLDSGSVQAQNMVGGIAPSGVGQAAPTGFYSQNGLESMSAADTFQQDKLREISVRAAETRAMNELATSTGGRAFYNTNGIQTAISLAVEEGSNYYTLSYNSSNRDFNGKFRRIKVSLGGKEYRLSYRPGYFAVNPEAPVKDANSPRRQRAVAMLHGTPLSRQLLFSVKVIPVGEKRKVPNTDPPPKDKKIVVPIEPLEVQHYAIDYSLPGSELHFSTLPNGKYHGALNLMVASFDQDGTLITGIVRHGVSDIEPAAYQEVSANEFRVHQEVDIPSQAASLRVGIQDDLTNHMGTVELSLPIKLPPHQQRAKVALPQIEPD